MEPSYFELLDKENDLSFDLSFLDSIALNEESKLDSVEATITFLTDGIKKIPDEAEHTKAIKKESKQKGKRFATPLSTKQIESLSTKLVPKKTSDSTKWAIRIFTDWCNERNGCPSALLDCPTDLFEHVKITNGNTGCHYGYPLSTLDFWLAAFVTEVRKADGGYYSPASLNCILAGLFRHMKDKFGANAPNFLSKSEANFSMFRNALDRQLRFLRGSGVGVERKRASIITAEDEDKLWTSGVLGIDNPVALLNAVFYLNGKSFCLRGVSEHYHLHFSQIVRKTNPDRYLYIEHGSKNRNGGIEDYKLESKCVTIVATKEGGIRDHVFILDTYLSKIPTEMIEKNERFYLRPMQQVSGYDGAPWFYRQNIGQHKVQTMVKSMFKAAEIDGKHTNHSLRATGASALFNAGVPEAVIQKRTGHKSTDALRLYERVSEDQQVAVANILASGSKQTTYDEQLKTARLKKEQTVEEVDLPPQTKKPKIDAHAATPAGLAFTPQQCTLFPPPGTTVFQNCVFHGCSMMPPQAQKNIIPQQAQPTSADFNMTMNEVEELFSPF